MLVDSHCHAWRQWPYQPPVPDPTSRGRVEQLLFEMDRNDVDLAMVVCARIDDNPDDNDYVAECVGRYPDRLVQIADVDCAWTDTYHAAGAAQRLADAVRTYGLKGFTHYVRGDDDGSWFLNEEGNAFFQTAAELHQLVSIALPASLQPVLRELAARFPTMPFLCHHMGLTKRPSSETLSQVLASAEVPNVHVKLSGFHYVSSTAWEYPFADCREIVRSLYDSFGPERLHWGSDYPVVRQFLTYQQTIEAVRTHCDFISRPDLDRILGDSLAALLK